jgi:hypothetical protein
MQIILGGKSYRVCHILLQNIDEIHKLQILKKNCYFNLLQKRFLKYLKF